MTAGQLPDSLRILTALRPLDEAGFASLLAGRRVASRGIGDLLDLAELLDSPRNVSDTLIGLDWPTLRGLRAGDEDALARAADLMLAVPEGDETALLPIVRSTLDALLPTLPDFEAAVGSESATAGATAAHAAAVLANDALWLLDEAPRAVRAARGGVRMSGVEVRRLAVELDQDAALIGSMYRWLLRAGLMAPLDEVWHPTAAGRAFIDLPAPHRWSVLIRAWLSELNLTDIRALQRQFGAGDDSEPAVTALPALEEEPTSATSAITLPGDGDARALEAELLGLAERGQLTAAGALVLAGKVDEAEAAFTDAFPREVEQVYLQPDQTIIAPGPLPGDLDAGLRRISALERRALASEYRITAASIAHALGEGMNEAEIRGFLERISLTGIPQPIDYLVTNTVERFGLVRVRDRSRGTARAGSSVRALDPKLFDAVRVDASLRSLGLRPAGEVLESTVSAHTVLVTLLDARYPAVAEDELGNALPLHPLITAPPYVADPGPTAAKAAADLATLAAESDVSDDHSTWLRRRLELARRAKTAIAVTVRVGEHETQTLRLVPTAVSPQRVRARDEDAEVERTLPLASIVSLDD